VGPKRAAAILCSGLVWVAGPARAQEDAPDRRALQAEIESDFAQAQTGDCLNACRALDSMRRASERLCTIDPGDACAKAQAKVRSATQRVRASCPECAAATATQKERSAEEPPAPPATPAPAPPSGEAKAAAPAQAEAPRKGGGCAACTMARSEEHPDLAVLLAALVGVVARARKRRSIEASAC
jgi:hypothetical protein